ncbi:hypothetical protein COU76_04405 [Candidatus Peregrinibacteria bacterium CG10_big_fil_rev_8_21_14_0_10_49_10]|nr:MAG: hypothetical protein COU76_04405 [Candidatus Peregrinibacteria bacterium CG10_big_fil_rev_8_21_14_0_10_49_10]
MNDEQRRKIDSALRRALGKEDLPDCSLMPLENDMMRIMASFTGPDFFDPDKTDTFPSCDVPIGTDVSIASIIEKFVCAFKSKVEATEEGKSLM